MRWLLLKDLQILRRSPLLVALLIAYPIVVSVLIGLALSRGPDKPKVAIVNQLAPEDQSFRLGGQQVGVQQFADQLFKEIDPVPVATRAQAIAKVRSGDVLGALIVPRDVTRRLQQALDLAGTAPPTVEAIYNIEDPLKGQLVESTITSRLADANHALSEQLTKLAARYLRVLLDGGDFSLLGQDFDVLGLKRSKQVLDDTLRSLAPGSIEADQVRRVAQFAQVAIDNLDLSGEVLTAVGQPLRVKRTVLSGRKTPIDAFAVAVSVTISLMFVTLLLGAGMLALEREEHAFGRLVRGLVSRVALLAEKVVLSAACALTAALVLLAGIAIFVHLQWGRFGLWLAALAVAALAFGALGVAIGAVAREVRAASLLGLLLALPIAFLALVPAGSVSGGLYDVVRVVSALFPFRPALQAIDTALNGSEPGLGPTLGHLAGLLVAYLVLARVAIGRFAR